MLYWAGTIYGMQEDTLTDGAGYHMHRRWKVIFNRQLMHASSYVYIS